LWLLGVHQEEADFGRCWTGVSQMLLEITFAEPHSPIAQHTLYAMGDAILNNFEKSAKRNSSLTAQQHFRSG